MEADKHGPDKIYDKFTVVKSKHVHGFMGESGASYKIFDPDKELTHKDEWIFVLRPEANDHAAVAALKTYARICAATYPQLSADIEEKLKQVRLTEIEGLKKP